MHDTVHVLCAQCLAFNRVPTTRLAAQPNCGKCQQALSPIPVALTETQFMTIAQKAQQPLVVDFWATWCGPCRSMAPHFAQAASQRPDLHFVKVDVDQAPTLSARFQIRSVPSVIVLKAGNEMDRIAGALSSSDLLRWLEKTTT